MKEEFDKIPLQYRGPYGEAYRALRQIPGSRVSWLDEDPASTGYGSVTTHPVYAGLRGVLKDEADARHLFQAKMAGITDILTLDNRTMLNKAEQLRRDYGLNVWTPSGFLSQLSTQSSAV